MKWYDCPKCGKPESSDGEHFCGACEEKYKQEQIDWKKQEREYLKNQIRNHADDCDCNLCNLVYRPWAVN